MVRTRLREPADTCGKKTAAGTHFQCVVVGLDLKGLQDSPFHFWSQHVLAMAKGHVRIGKGKIAQGHRHEIFAGHALQRREDTQVEDFPGSHLLLDHLAAGEIGRRT